MINFNYTIWILLLPFPYVFISGDWQVISIFQGSQVYWEPAGLAVITVLSYIYCLPNTFLQVKRLTEHTRKIIAFNFTWLQFTDKLHIDIGALLDPISVMMLIVITTVSLMVHIYSLGYMKGEKGFERFFSFSVTFQLSMLGFGSRNKYFPDVYLLELVGVSSYLLIGFYYQKPSAVRASKKAFIVTRFADLGFLIGISDFII